MLPALDPEFTVIDCSAVILTDYSASTAFQTILKQYSELNKRCKLMHLDNPQSRKTVLRDRDLRRILSRIDETTYIVLTQDELTLRRRAKDRLKQDKKRARASTKTERIVSQPADPSSQPVHHEQELQTIREQSPKDDEEATTK